MRQRIRQLCEELPSCRGGELLAHNSRRLRGPLGRSKPVRCALRTGSLIGSRLLRRGSNEARVHYACWWCGGIPDRCACAAARQASDRYLSPRSPESAARVAAAFAVGSRKVASPKGRNGVFAAVHESVAATSSEAQRYRPRGRACAMFLPQASARFGVMP